MPTVTKRPEAKRDLIGHFVYLVENANEDTAERFLRHAEARFLHLSQHPFMGSLLNFRNPSLSGMRKWRVNHFEKFLIFYLPRVDGVNIVRVLHSARDWGRRVAPW